MKRRLLEAGQRLGGVIAQLLPEWFKPRQALTASSRRTLSRRAAGSRSPWPKGHDALRENFSFFLFLVVGQAELAADLIKGNRNRFDVVRPKCLPSEKRPDVHCILFRHKKCWQQILFSSPTHSLNGALAAAGDVPVPYSIFGPEVVPNPYKPGVQCSRPDRHSVSPKRPPGTGW
jgi:hypothetical protein